MGRGVFRAKFKREALKLAEHVGASKTRTCTTATLSVQPRRSAMDSIRSRSLDHNEACITKIYLRGKKVEVMFDAKTSSA